MGKLLEAMVDSLEKLEDFYIEQGIDQTTVDQFINEVERLYQLKAKGKLKKVDRQGQIERLAALNVRIGVSCQKEK